MLNEKAVKGAENRIKQYISESIIKTKGEKRFVQFFVKNAEDSIDAAKVLLMLSIEPEKQKVMGFAKFNGLLWVVNASYYSMFYMARALLESEGIKITSDMFIHAKVFDALVHFFYKSGKLQKKLIEDYAEANEEASELLGKQKAESLIEDYLLEKKKRGTFTYEMGAIVLQSKAKTSLERAKRFCLEIKKKIREE